MRSILSIIAGTIVGIFSIFLIEMINLSIYPVPVNLDISDKSYGSFILIIIAHMIGSFISSFIASMVARSNRLYIGYITGLTLLFFTIWYLVDSGNPSQVICVAIIGSTLAIILGARIGKSRIVG